MFIDLPPIKKNLIEKRDYQINIALTCLKSSTLVVLPTGLGKTIIALYLIASNIKKEGKILFLAPTKPLVEQHANYLKESMDFDKITTFTGEVSPKKRKELWDENKIIISTPQVIENDIISQKINLKDVALIIFDEAHRAVGNYSYVFIAEKFRENQNGLTLGITASPGSDAEKILNVCNNLDIKNVEIRSENDRDVREYVQYIKIQWTRVDIPKAHEKILDALNDVYVEKLKTLKNFGLLERTTMVSKKKLLEVSQKIQYKMKQSMRPQKSLFYAASVQSQALKVAHAIELCETQGIFALKDYFSRLENEAYSRGGSKGAKVLIDDERIQNAIKFTNEAEIEHPKIEKIINIVKEQFNMKKESRIIVFTNYRDTSILVSNELNKLKNVNSVRFVGQAKRGEDKGLRQKEQVEIIQKFKDGVYNLMVATSVAEEGLDIPTTDLVIFYEPIASEIRTIQRRGRTGRKKPGRVVILITRKTRDEAYYWTSRSKEKSMKRELEFLREDLQRKIKTLEKNKDNIIVTSNEYELLEENLKYDTKDNETSKIYRKMNKEKIDIIKNTSKLDKKAEIKKSENHLKKEAKTEKEPEIDKNLIEEPENFNEYDNAITDIIKNRQITKKGQLQILDFEDESDVFKIIVDTREFKSNVVRELSRKNIPITSEQLDIGDYILSDRVGVERKIVDDFLQSLIDGRLFSQLRHLKERYMKPVLILEGEGLFTKRHIQHSAIYGSMASIIIDFNIPIISTKDATETAQILATIGKREFESGRKAGIRGEKGKMSFRERQQFLIEGLPNVSAILAQRLLSHFGSIKNIMDADLENLMEVKGIGKKIAQGIVEIIQAGYLKK